MALQSSMAEALRLTRVGNLAEASAVLRSALSGGGATPALRSSSAPTSLTPDRVRLAAADAPSESLFETRRHSGPAGVMEYMLYRPADAAPGMPLVVMLHGCTQSPEDFARGTGMNRLADTLGFLVAYPRQTKAANMQRCWNWFQPDHQARDRGEPALIAGLVRDILAAEAADPARVYVAGLSAGGAAANRSG